MAVFVFSSFGGLVPKASARALPLEAAQTANNLAAGTMEFRPLAADTQVIANSGITNPRSMYRFQTNSDGTLNTDFSNVAKWQFSLIPRSYVRSQLNNDTTERTYVTIDDGSAAPRVIDNGGGDRQLGVPTPTTAATVTVNTVDEFTTDERSADIQAAIEQAVAAVKANVEKSWTGAEHPGAATTGYLDESTANNFAVDNDARMVRVYRLSGAGGTVTNDYTALDAGLFSWIFDPLIEGQAWVADGSSPVWAGGAATQHWAIPFYAYGVTITLDTAQLETDLRAIAMPGTTDGSKLFTTDQVDEIVAALDALVDPTRPELKTRLDALKSEVAKAKVLLDGGAHGALVAATTAFYSKTDVDDFIDDAKANFAEALYNAAYGIVRSSLPADYYASPGDMGT